MLFKLIRKDWLKIRHLNQTCKHFCNCVKKLNDPILFMCKIHVNEENYSGNNNHFFSPQKLLFSKISTLKLCRRKTQSQFHCRSCRRSKIYIFFFCFIRKVRNTVQQYEKNCPGFISMTLLGTASLFHLLKWMNLVMLLI